MSNKEPAGTSPEAAGADRALIADHMDAAFYRSQLSERVDDPAAHFLRDGWKAGLDPSPDFSTRYYLDRSPDVREAGMNPYLHYLRWGRDEGRAPNPARAAPRGSEEETDPDIAILRQNFDIEFYAAQNPRILECHVDPVLHYHLHGWKAGRDPSPHFATAHYLERNRDVREAGIDPFLHYLKWGRHEGRQPHPGAPARRYVRGRTEDRRRKGRIAGLFDADFYRSQHPEFAGNDADPVLHFLAFGWRQDFDPSPDFSTAFYRAHHPADAFEAEDPLTDYARRGHRLGSIPKACHPVLRASDDAARLALQERLLDGHFDAAHYAAGGGDLHASAAELLRDYLISGWQQGRDPAPWFSVEFYRQRYPRFAGYGLDPLSHYLVWGRGQGFRTRPDLPAGRAAVQIGAAHLSDRAAMLDRATAPQPETGAAPDGACDPRALDIHWVVPNVGAGSGGAMTIFRIVHWLEYLGHRCTIWIDAAGPVDIDQARDDILKHYQFVKADLREASDGLAEAQGDILIATFWDTAFRVAAAAGFRERCYFVQDHEPSFYPAGSQSVLAGTTYGLGLGCICAGPWLRELLERRYGCWARDFRLACDDGAYFPPDPDLDPSTPPPDPDRPEATPRIALYGRTETERRCSDLAFLALERLARRGVRFHADIFGSYEAGEAGPDLPFPATFHGILSPEELGALYRACDIGICFSATNYSLVPQEMMACGLPVIELDLPNARRSIGEDAALFAAPHPDAIAEAAARLLEDAALRRAQARRGLDWAGTQTWEDAARAVEAALHERLAAGSWIADPAPLPSPALARSGAPKASVIVPTLNGGAMWCEALERIAGQRTDFVFDLVVVDSGSQDGSAEAARALPFARVIEIAPSEFQHGRTRNLAASEAAGEYLVFLTQDALPADAFWLYNFIGTMDLFPEAAGGFGKHYAHVGAPAFIRRDLRNHFAGLGLHPLLVSKHTDIRGWNARTADFLRMLHFYSDNNSCMRRSAWQDLPYPEVDYGEDQLWAWQAVQRGWARLYCPNAAVRHSHDHGYAEALERAETEAHFFRTHFGYDLSQPDPDRAIAARHADTERVALTLGAPPDAVARRKCQQTAQVLGWSLGRWRADSEVG